MLKNKKSMELPITIIIVAIIALIVLVVSLTIFSSKTGDVVDTLDSCASRGGNCMPSCSGNSKELPKGECPELYNPSIGSGMPQKCCLKVE